MVLKDWILLLTPVLCNGLVLFVLQKLFEKKQASTVIRNEYISLLRNKIDLALGAYIDAVVSDGDDEKQDIHLQRFIDNYNEVLNYCYQNDQIFSKLSDQLNAITNEQTKMRAAFENESDVPRGARIAPMLKNVVKELKKMQTACIRLEV